MEYALPSGGGGGGTLNFSSCVGFDSTSTVNLKNIKHTPKRYLKFATPVPWPLEKALIYIEMTPPPLKLKINFVKTPK